MNGYFTVGLAIVGIAIYYFYESNRVKGIRKEDRRENRLNQQKEIIQSLLKKKTDVRDDQDSGAPPETIS